LLNKHSLHVSGNLHKEKVGEPCQVDKNKQLQFHASTRVSPSPLELIQANNVWYCSSKSMSGCS